MSKKCLESQSNANLELIHQVQEDGLVTFDLEGTLIDLDEEDPFDEYLTVVLYAIRSSFHQLHGHSPTSSTRIWPRHVLTRFKRSRLECNTK